MELILILVAVVFQYGLFLITPLLILFMAFKAGQKIGKTAGIAVLQWLIPFAVLGVPLIWVVAGYASFTEQCRSLANPSFVSFPNSRPNGFFLDEEGIAQSPFH
ncbi:MAG: hypothetical protein R8K20_08255, partial [Gallionellaceae bacterium]